MKYIELLVSSPSSKSNLLTILLEVGAEMLGLPGLGLAVGWAISGYFEDARTKRNKNESQPDQDDTVESDLQEASISHERHSRNE